MGRLLKEISLNDRKAYIRIHRRFEDLYRIPEMEMKYHDVRYLVTGYRDEDNEYVLQVDTIERQSSEVFFCEKEGCERVC